MTPDKLYTSTRIQRFMRRCKDAGVEWAIFSDKYGVWFPHVRRRWYEKPPDEVTFAEFKKLVRDFDRALQDYDEIYFYHNPGRFGTLYRCLLCQTKLKERVVLFSHPDDIGAGQSNVPDACKWLHERLEKLPIVKFPFNLEDLPQNGIYFFYEQGEAWGHGGDHLRIVRIGSHTGRGNFRSRIAETYLLDETRLDFNENSVKPADRSIFRKNIGRALLNRSSDDYLQVWDIDFTARTNRESFGHLRDIEKEKRLEHDISRMLRQRFCFRFIIVDDPIERTQHEKRLIGTIAQCKVCTPSEDWLGRHSPKQKIREGNLWQEQSQAAAAIDAEDQEAIRGAIERTKEWIASRAHAKTPR